MLRHARTIKEENANALVRDSIHSFIHEANNDGDSLRLTHSLIRAFFIPEKKNQMKNKNEIQRRRFCLKFFSQHHH
jgi:hypothetical protein